MHLDQPTFDRYRQLYEEAPIAYTEVDTGGKVVSVNNAACVLLGYEAAQLIGCPVWELGPLSDREQTRTEILRKLEGKTELRPFVWENRRGDGTFAHVEIHECLVRDAEGKVIGIRAALLDITERLRVEEETRESRAWLATTLQSIRDGVIATDALGSVKFMNSAAERLTGWNEEDARGASLEKVCLIIPKSGSDPSANNGSLSWRLLQQVIYEDAVTDSRDELLILDRQRRTREVSLTISPIYMSPQNVIGTVLIAREKTVREHTESNPRLQIA